MGLPSPALALQSQGPKVRSGAEAHGRSAACPFALESGGAPRTLACKLPLPSVTAGDGRGCCRLQSAAQLQPEGSPGTSDLPAPKAGCFALRQRDSSASFLSYFMHHDGHSSQDEWDSYPRKLRANGERPGKRSSSITERGHGSESQRQTSIYLFMFYLTGAWFPSL